MPGLAGSPAQAMRSKEPLAKDDVTRLLGTLGPEGLNPEDFLVDTNTVARLFAPKNQELFSFVLIADPQIEERSVRFGPWLTHFVDKNMKIETTVRGFIQDHADVFYFGFVLKAIRLALEMNTNVGFVVGLGDAMQVGRKPELTAFNQMIGKFLVAGHAIGWENSWSGTWLETPIPLPDGRESRWFNMIGNHDVLIMGNFRGSLPIRVPDGAITSLDELQRALEETPPFNALCRTNHRPALGQGTAGCGYYQVDRRLPDGQMMRLVVLNTSERALLDPLIPKLQRGACYPSLSGEQFDWLRNTLAEAETNDSIGLVLVFGHYPLLQVTVNRTGKRSDRDRSYGEVKNLLGEFPKVKAYFCGHLHPGSPPKEHWFGNHTVLEYICPSLQEFPKCFGRASVSKDPVSGEYTTAVRYYNLEDLLDPASFPSLQTVAESGHEDQQTQLAAWLVRLRDAATGRIERLQLLAKYCYLSSIYDVQRDRRTDISICFHPKFARQLLQEYSGAQQLWEQIKRDPCWSKVRLALETQPPSTPVVFGITDSRSAQKALAEQILK